MSQLSTNFHQTTKDRYQAVLQKISLEFSFYSDGKHSKGESQSKLDNLYVSYNCVLNTSCNVLTRNTGFLKNLKKKTQRIFPSERNPNRKVGLR